MLAGLPPPPHWRAMTSRTTRSVRNCYMFPRWPSTQSSFWLRWNAWCGRSVGESWWSQRGCEIRMAASSINRPQDPQVDPLQRPMTGGVGQYLATVASDRLGIRCRCEKPGLLGRASIAHVSQQDVRDSAAVGRAAVQALSAGARDVMVALRPLKETNVADTTLVPLAAEGERNIPPNWLGPDNIPFREEFFEYLRPLVGTKDHHLRDLGAPISGIGE